MKAANLRASARPKPGAPSFASFASLRLSENRRLNEEADLSQRRGGVKRFVLRVSSKSGFDRMAKKRRNFRLWPIASATVFSLGPSAPGLQGFYSENFGIDVLEALTD